MKNLTPASYSDNKDMITQTIMTSNNSEECGKSHAKNLESDRKNRGKRRRRGRGKAGEKRKGLGGSNGEDAGHVTILDKERYKTEMCHSFVENNGYCRYGAKCQYAHGESELREGVTRPTQYKTRLCRTYHTRGYCPYGSRCHFIHSELDSTQIVSVADWAGPKSTGLTKQNIDFALNDLSQRERSDSISERIPSINGDTGSVNSDSSCTVESTGFVCRDDVTIHPELIGNTVDPVASLAADLAALLLEHSAVIPCHRQRCNSVAGMNSVYTNNHREFDDAWDYRARRNTADNLPCKMTMRDSSPVFTNKLQGSPDWSMYSSSGYSTNQSTPGSLSPSQSEERVDFSPIHMNIAEALLQPITASYLQNPVLDKFASNVESLSLEYKLF